MEHRGGGWFAVAHRHPPPGWTGSAPWRTARPPRSLGCRLL